jgi:DNA-binding NarL/FixJ family response regulator
MIRNPMPDPSLSQVLLVGSNVLERISVTRLLQEAGFNVLPLASADEALQALQVTPAVQAVVIDGELPSSSVNAFDLVRQIKLQRPIETIVLGSVPSSLTEVPVGVHVLSKPVYPATLVALVGIIVRSHAASTPDKSAASTRAGAFVFPAMARAEQEIVSQQTEADFVAPKPRVDSLTPRQWDVLELLVTGKSNRDIAQALGLSQNTIKVHLVAIFKALGVSTRVEALLAGMRRLQTERPTSVDPQIVSDGVALPAPGAMLQRRAQLAPFWASRRKIAVHAAA